MLMGDYKHAIDAKGRLFMPYRLKEDLGDTFYLLRGPHAGMLLVYPQKTFQVLAEKIENIPLNDFEAQDAASMFLAGSQKGELDKQGRVLINQELRDHGQLAKDCFIQGKINRVEIWDLEIWQQRMQGLSSEGTFADAFSKLQQYGL